MTSKHIVVAAHGHCFDGICSAAMFCHLRSRLNDDALRFSYRSCGYGPNMQTVPVKWLRGDENAIVDFRFTPSGKLTWYFDHHPTGFANDRERDRALEKHPKRYFFDPSYGSCTKLIADVGKQRFGVDFSDFAELVSWADRIDSASFASASEAIDRSHAIMQLAAVVEHHGNGALFESLVPRLAREPIEDIATDAEVQSLWQPIDEAQRSTRERIANAAERKGRVVYVDLHDAPLASSGKFVAYAVAPDCMYSVSLIRMKRHFKISLGFNPWCGRDRDRHIGRICQRFGGGGHPVVGAFSMPLDQLDKARAIAGDIVTELN